LAISMCISAITQARQRLGAGVMRQLFHSASATNGYSWNSRSFYQRTLSRSDRRNLLRYPVWVMKMLGFLVVREVVQVQEQRFRKLD